MLQIIRSIVSIIVSVEIAFGCMAGGGFSKAPEIKAEAQGEYTRLVDPFIGTGGIPWASAMLSPAATVPFGNVRLGPDTCFIGGAYLFKTNTSGYYYEQRHIKGFSHGRLSGTGVEELGDFRVIPRVGKVDVTRRKNQPLPYSHDKEAACPGYYAVYLPTVSCLAELTASEHAGYHRYTFGTSKDAHLLIDAASVIGSKYAENTAISYDPEAGVITGKALCQTEFSGRHGGTPLYFYAVCSIAAESFSVWNGKDVFNGQTSAEGDDTGLDLCFGNISGKPVTLRTAVSNISIENAKLNLEAEIGERSFDDIRLEADEKWNERLSAISIGSASDEVKVVFYTSLYHTMIMPTNYTDVNGEYLGFDRETGIADGFTYRTDMSLWDTCRNTHSLYGLIAVDIQTDCLKSLVRMAQAGGTLPRWPSGCGYSGSMFGTPADIVIAESYLKGIRDFDYETAYEYMKKTSEEAFPGVDYRDGIESYNKNGYCAYDEVNKSAARTLEYAWEDSAIANLAEALGKTEDAEKFRTKAKYYRNIFDPDSKYFRARNADGSWGPLAPNITEFYDAVLIKKLATAYSEGSARHWRWSVIHDPEGLIELFGSKEYFVKELEKFMKDASLSRAAIDPGPGYWIGNQHDIHSAYLFNYAGRADLTQKWVRWTLSDRYSTDINGLDGNDDGGTLSAWYVFSALGFYPQAGTARYWIGSPCIGSAEIKLSNGSVLSIKALNQSDDNIYIQSVTLNGERLTAPFIEHSMIENGGELVFTMGSTPAENGGF